MWRGAGLIAAVLALAGCKGLSTKPVEKDKDPAATTAARDKVRPPAWLDGGGKDPVPTAGTWSKPRDPGFDARAEARRVLAGKVFDPIGKPVPSAYIRIDPVDATAEEKAGNPVGILTKDDGSFMTQMLEANRTYTLTVAVTLEGKPLRAEVQTRVPNATLTIVLRDDLIPPASPGPTPAAGIGGLPPRPAPPPVPAPGIPPPSSELIPPLGASSPPPPSAERGWGPDAGSGTRSVPAAIPTPGPTPTPGTPPAPVPVPSVTPTPPFTTIRPESTAGPKDNTFRPPVLSTPPGLAPPPVTPLPAPVPPVGKQSSRPVRPAANNFALIDTLERPWEFATNRYEPLVLVSFTTTTCVPCKKAAPILADIQARYSAMGLQMLGVLCDDGTLQERITRAAEYHRQQNLNYALYVEPQPGQVRQRFHVESYPTAILLDESGTVLWRGQPQAERAALEAAIRRRLAK